MVPSPLLGEAVEPGRVGFRKIYEIIILGELISLDVPILQTLSATENPGGKHKSLESPPEHTEAPSTKGGAFCFARNAPKKPFARCFAPQQKLTEYRIP